jgi:4-alpha-glucanotransferase
MRRHAHERGVEIIGDVPLYVAPDSVDVWLNPELFVLDAGGQPTRVAGVPPDMFSATGQRWGNPLYRWDVHRRSGYSWWADRLRTFFSQSDVLRIDHFTGLVTYYEIEASDPTAMGGVWQKGPGREFFEQVEKALGPLRVIVEDLGPAGQIVEDARLELGYPGMEVLQELFVKKGPYEEIAEDRVVYTGTHDNDTALGRFEAESSQYRRRALRYTGSDEGSFADGLVESAWGSDGVIAITPMQDLLGLGTEARMNYPSTPTGNWRWRMVPGAASALVSEKLTELNQRHDRVC